VESGSPKSRLPQRGGCSPRNFQWQFGPIFGRFIDPTDQTEDLIKQAQALARCDLVPEARRKLRNTLLLLDDVNDPSKRAEVMMDMNKAFVRQASYSDSLDLARQAFTPKNALDLYSDALLEATFVEHPELEKIFKPLRDETIYEI
jgi:hypothetical protein